MTKPDYTELDAAILTRIEEREFCHLTALEFNGAVRTAVQSIQKKQGSDRPAWRILDGRLQSLRKAGKIAHDHTNGWRLA